MRPSVVVKGLLTALFFSVVWPLRSSLLFAEGAPGQLVVAHISAERAEQIVAAVAHRVVLNGQELPRKASEPALVVPWSSNKPSLIGRLERVSFDWAREGERVVSLTLRFGFDGLIISSGFGTKQKEGHGFEFALGYGERRYILLAGSRVVGREGFVVALAPRSDDGGVRALICPRRLREVSGRPLGFSDSELRIQQSSGVVSAKIDSSLLSGFGPGFIQATLLVTPGVARAVEYIDRTRRRDPSLSLQYRPLLNSGGTERSQLVGDEPWAEGIEVRLRMQNNAGFQRENVLSDVVKVKKMQLTATQSFPVDTYGIEQGEGVCYAVEQERTKDELFTRQPLAELDPLTWRE